MSVFVYCFAFSAILICFHLPRSILFCFVCRYLFYFVSFILLCLLQSLSLVFVGFLFL